MKSISIPILTCDLLGGPKIQLGGFFMKVKEEDLRRELLKAINGEDLIINCLRSVLRDMSRQLVKNYPNN